MTEQLALDFTISAAQRHRRAIKAAEVSEQPTLFASWSPNIDIHLHSPTEAIAQISGPEPERAHNWLAGLVGSIRPIKSRRVAFPSDKLDRLLHVRPPAQVTLDAAAAAVGRALWAHKLGLKPLHVRRERQRLFADSPRWPRGFRVKDAPWTAIATVVQLGLGLNVDDNAKTLLRRKLEDAGAKVAAAGLAGSAVVIETSRPEIVENLGLPGLAYSGEPRAGQYKIPLLASEKLLRQQVIDVPPQLAEAIKKATSPTKPLLPRHLPGDFPWTLFDFQATDAGKALRILETTGGVLLAGDMGSGKALAHGTTVYTPTGPVPVERLRIGDQVLGQDGRPHAVLGVYPQGDRELFRVTFSDRTSVVVDADHLWAVHSPEQKRRGHPGKVLKTGELDAGGLRDAAGNCRWYIPVARPLQFTSEESRPLPAYTLGAYLGHGGSATGSAVLTDAEQEVLECIRADLAHGDLDGLTFTVKPGSRHDYVITDSGKGRPNRFNRALRELGLWGTRSWEKRVPSAYLYAPETERRALLQGVLDTDGGVSSKGKSPSSIELTSTSEQFAGDVAWLVQSLGGTARISEKARTTGYRYNGEHHRLRPSWRVSICLPADVEPFRMPRKRAEYRPRVKYGPARAITSIEPVGTGQATCIQVDSPDHLFLTEHAIVTHNTTVSLALAAHMDIWPLLVVAPLSAFSTWARQLEEMGRSFYLATETPKKSWEAMESGHHDAVVISYDRLPAFVELVERLHFKGLVADEIQRIRTPGSKRSRALRTLAASVPLRIGLSGTPMTNTVADLLPVGAVLAPGEWRPRANSKDLEDMYPGDPVEAIAEHLGCLMVRRRIDQVGRPMPTRNDHRIYVELTPEQRSALAALEAEAQAAKESGEFDGPNGKFNALVKLGRMRSILANPRAAGVAGPNPKVDAAVRLIKDFHAQGRKGVVFTVDRASFSDLGEELTREGIRWGGIWGSTPPMERIEVEKRLHRGELDVVICTVAAGAESWTASPTATYCAFLSYVWAPSSLAQAEARVYRLNADLDGPAIEIVYLHASAPGGSLDDRMVEVLELKKTLFTQVVDRDTYVDTTQVHTKLSDLLYVLTGTKDDGLEQREKDAAAAREREQAKKKHAQRTLYARKGRNKSRTDLVHDDGSTAMTLEEHQALTGAGELGADPDIDTLLEVVDYSEDGLDDVDGLDAEDGFDVLDDD